MILYLGQPDWGAFDIPDCAEWKQRFAPGRFIMRIELVDEGRARLHTVLEHVALARRPDVNPWWWDLDWCYHHDGPGPAGVICTAVYVPTSALPRPILERMHP